MATTTAYKQIRIPEKDGWVQLTVPAVDIQLYCGTRVAIPEHTIEVALRYPTFEDGNLASGMTQKQVAELMEGYAGQGLKGGLALYEDQFLRNTLGKEHEMFDENFERNGAPWRWGYVIDYNRSSSEGMVDGVNQKLVTRIAGYRLPSGDEELGVTTIAPSGMVPLFTKAEFEKRYGATALKTLERLGMTIPESKKEIIKPWNALGYPQFTLDHDYTEDGELIPHSHHLYTPSQNDSERVGVRDAIWPHRGGLRCFYVSLDRGPGDSHSDGAFPLVRGGRLK